MRESLRTRKLSDERSSNGSSELSAHQLAHQIRFPISKGSRCQAFIAAAEPSIAYVYVLCWAFFRATYKPAGSVFGTTRTETRTPFRRNCSSTPPHRDLLMQRGPAERSGSGTCSLSRSSLLFSCPVSSHFCPCGWYLSSSTSALLPRHRLSGSGSRFSRGLRARPR